MATTKPFTTIIFDEEMFKRIDDFRFNNRFSSRSQAVLYLIRAGMDALKEEYPELDMSSQLETGKRTNKKNVLLEEENNSEQSSV